MVRDLVEFLCKSVVDQPEHVQVKQLEEHGLLRIEVRVAADDMGKVIGRQGRMIGAIRQLARAAAVKSGAGRVLVEVAE
ncbi:MAG TPA: KH domain-containing protein [Bacillota bacterium]|nr:KH domain-containing protein [Bacillota bacterium]